MSDSGKGGKASGSATSNARLYLLLTFSHLERLLSALSAEASYSTAGEAGCCVPPFQPEGVKAEACKEPWDITQSKPHTETGCKTSRLSLTGVSLTLS